MWLLTILCACLTSAFLCVPLSSSCLLQPYLSLLPDFLKSCISFQQKTQGPSYSIVYCIPPAPGSQVQGMRWSASSTYKEGSGQEKTESRWSWDQLSRTVGNSSLPQFTSLFGLTEATSKIFSISSSTSLTLRKGLRNFHSCISMKLGLTEPQSWGTG